MSQRALRVVRHEVRDATEQLCYGLTEAGSSLLTYNRWTGTWAADSPWRWLADEAPPAWLIGALFEPLRALFERPARLALHGSAVCFEGQTVIVMGQSGAGKSTTILELMRQGGELLSDDRTQLEAGVIMPEEVAGIRLWPWVGEPPGALRWVGMPGRGDKRWWLLQPTPRAPRAPEKLVVLSPRDDAPPEGRMVRCEGMDAWRLLLEQTFDVSHPWPEWASRRLAQSRQLVQRHGVWRLEFARDAQRRPLQAQGMIRWLRSQRR